jgi:hypothetical protein
VAPEQLFKTMVVEPPSIWSVECDEHDSDFRSAAYEEAVINVGSS